MPQHMPGLDAASCNLRAAACDWPTARGLRLADCGSRVCSQTKQLCRHHAHMPGIDSASCNLRRAPCGRPTTRGLRLAERRLATRKRVERRHSTRIASCASQLAGCDPAGRSEMVCCIPSLTHKYTPRCSHLLGRALSQVAPRRNWGLVACDVLSWSRVWSARVVDGYPYHRSRKEAARGSQEARAFFHTGLHTRGLVEPPTPDSTTP